MSLNPTPTTAALGDQENGKHRRPTGKKRGRPHTVSPAIRAWGYPLLLTYRTLPSRLERMNYKAEQMRQFERLPLANPHDQQHDGFFPANLTREQLLFVRHY